MFRQDIYTSVKLTTVCPAITTRFSNPAYPVRTRRRFNVHTTSKQRCGRCMDVETTLRAYRVT